MTDLRRQHQDDVKEIGEKVGELVKDAKIKERFTGQIKRFCEKVEKYGQDLQAYREKQPKLSPERKKILATIKKEGRLLSTEGEIGLIDLTHVLPSPPDSFDEMCYADYAFINDSLHFSCRPAKLVNPLLWFDIFSNADIQQKPKPADKLMCDYVKLAVIHDCSLRGVEFLAVPVPDPYPPYPSVWMYETIFPDKYEGQWFKREEFRKQVWQHYSHTQIPLVHCVNPMLLDSTFRAEFLEAVDSQYSRELKRELQKKLSELEDALEHIKADLASEQEKDTRVKPIQKEPSDESRKAYQLYGVLGNQIEVAKKMNKEYGRKNFYQGKVSRLITQYKEWLATADLPDVNKKPKIKVEHVSTDFIEMGKRQDGNRATGRQLNKGR